MRAPVTKGSVEAVWDEAPDVMSSVAAVFDGAARTLEDTDFAVACPIATVALEVASTNEQLRLATAGGLRRLDRRLHGASRS